MRNALSFPTHKTRPYHDDMSGFDTMLLSVFCYATVLFTSAFTYHQHWRLQKQQDNANDFNDVNVKAGTIELPLDHFNSSNTETFLNRYWYNDKYAKEGGPFFLSNHGEASVANHTILFFVVEHSLAKKYGAIEFLIEHRFYGESLPKDGATLKNLQYLTSLQALEDMRVFIQAMNEKFKSSPRWIMFGGSYSGSLAAWMREKYPDDVYAAVASSAPLNAIVDFTGYQTVVYEVFKEINPKCTLLIKEGFETLNELLKTPDGRDNVTNTFGDLVPPNANAEVLTRELSFPYGIYIQYLSPVFDPCKYIENATTPYQGMALFQQHLSTLKPLYNQTDFNTWQFQTCNEFGFFQTTDNLQSSRLFGNITSLSFYTDLCDQLFGIQVPQIFKSVQATNNNYGGVKGYTGTRVVFPNGKYDPWHPLGVLKPVNNETYPILIENATHCADMKPSTSEYVLKAQEEIARYVENWINAP